MISTVIAFLVGIISVVGYLYSTGSTLNWSPKKKA